MDYEDKQVQAAAHLLRDKLKKLQDKRSILRAPELIALIEQIKTLPAGEPRAKFGQQVNKLKGELEKLVSEASLKEAKVTAIDITAPFDENTPENKKPKLLPQEYASSHPLSTELKIILDIFSRMGFTAVESREIDDDYHMFGSLNFPEGHPARDDYDTFVTEEGLIAPAHTSTMQNRVLKMYRQNLKDGKSIAVVLPGRVFRNEDLDARHEHTFHQFEGVYVDAGINAGNLIAALKTFFQHYFGKEIKVKIQPFYFPFTEPSFEFAASCPFCDGQGCNVCSHTGWIELLGMGMIHPNVLKEAGIDSEKYTGFAWGCGIERLVMLKYNIEDIRHFHSGDLRFLRQYP